PWAPPGLGRLYRGASGAGREPSRRYQALMSTTLVETTTGPRVDPAAVEAAVRALADAESQTLANLCDLARIRSVSARPVPDPHVRMSAERTAERMREAGLSGVELLEIDGAHPYVLGHRVEDPALPTLLLYAHHDVQPEGDPERWTSPPYEPTRRGD